MAALYRTAILAAMAIACTIGGAHAWFQIIASLRSIP